MTKKATVFFGSNLKTLRIKQKKNQEDMANTIEISRNVLSNYETGYSFPDFNTLIRIVILFDINAHDLLFKDLSKEAGATATFDKGDADLRYIIELQKARIADLEKQLEELVEQLQPKKKNKKTV